MNVQQLVNQAITNSKTKAAGQYKFKDLLNSGQFPFNTPQDIKTKSEIEFYNAVQQGSVPNVSFIKKATGNQFYYRIG
jgi:hypothetical protein